MRLKIKKIVTKRTTPMPKTCAGSSKTKTQYTLINQIHISFDIITKPDNVGGYYMRDTRNQMQFHKLKKTVRHTKTEQRTARPSLTSEMAPACI